MTVLSYATASQAHVSIEQHDVPYPAGRFAIRATWPRFSSKCPSDVPANVETYYEQGLESLSGGRWDAAGAMFRKSLHVATKLIAPEKRAKTLYGRINELVSEGELTQAMGEWSHQIRLDGNDAVQDEEPETEQGANVMQRFTEAFLTYSFTLPAKVQANHAKRQPAIDAAASAAA